MSADLRSAAAFEMFSLRRRRRLHPGRSRRLGAGQRGWVAEVEALSVVDAELRYKAGRLLVVDKFGDRFFAHAGGDVHYRFDKEAVGCAGAAVLDELAVDLEEVEGEVFEV